MDKPIQQNINWCPNGIFVSCLLSLARPPTQVVLMPNFLGLVMEWAPGGSLTELITAKYSEWSIH